jgi:hypothetical protein
MATDLKDLLNSCKDALSQSNDLDSLAQIPKPRAYLGRNGKINDLFKNTQ